MKFKIGDEVKFTAKYIMNTGYQKCRGKVGVIIRVYDYHVEVGMKHSNSIYQYIVSLNQGYLRKVDK